VTNSVLEKVRIYTVKDADNQQKDNIQTSAKFHARLAV